MSKFDAAIPTTWTTASTLVVSTRDCILHGICVQAGATATAGSIVAHETNTTGNSVFAISVSSSGGINNDGPYQPVVCQGGLVTVCTGTAFNYVVYFANLHP